MVGIVAALITSLDGCRTEAEFFQLTSDKAIGTVRGVIGVIGTVRRVIGDSTSDTPPVKNQPIKDEREQAQDTPATEPQVAAVEQENRTTEKTAASLPSPERWFEFTLIRDAPLWTYSGERADIADWIKKGESIQVRRYHEGWLEVWTDAGTDTQRLAGYIHEQYVVPPE